MFKVALKLGGIEIPEKGSMLRYHIRKSMFYKVDE